VEDVQPGLTEVPMTRRLRSPDDTAVVRLPPEYRLVVLMADVQGLFVALDPADGAVRALIGGRWAVLSGHSGVGKSSLFNRLIPGAEREVADLGRLGGRHTTVSPRAMRVPGIEDTWLVDTPGVRSFGIGHLPAEDLWWAFPELRDLDCELPGCLHDGEPGCAAPELVGDGIHPARFDSYRRFLAGLRGGDEAEQPPGSDRPS
jgi:ribosome biogenesis GTPase / thiamine phosphate phosphatase